MNSKRSIPTPKAILFDHGDTLHKVEVDVEPGIRRLFDLVDQRHQIDFGESRKVGDALANSCEAIRQTVNYEISFEAFHRNLFDRKGFTSKYSWAELDLEFMKASHVWKIEPGIRELLEYSKAVGIAVGGVSNSFHRADSLMYILRDIGIADYFKFVISSADYGFRKPHPEIFETAIAKIGVPRDRIWFIGDKPEADIAGAKSVGITSVWYNARNEPPREPEADLTVKSWGELMQMINTND